MCGTCLSWLRGQQAGQLAHCLPAKPHSTSSSFEPRRGLGAGMTRLQVRAPSAPDPPGLEAGGGPGPPRSPSSTASACRHCRPSLCTLIRFHERLPDLGQSTGRCPWGRVEAEQAPHRPFFRQTQREIQREACAKHIFTQQSGMGDCCVTCCLRFGGLRSLPSAEVSLGQSPDVWSAQTTASTGRRCTARRSGKP